MNSTRIPAISEIDAYKDFLEQHASLDVAFHSAVFVERLDIIRIPAPRINVNCKNPSTGDTALHIACRNNQPLTIKLFGDYMMVARQFCCA